MGGASPSRYQCPPGRNNVKAPDNQPRQAPDYRNPDQQPLLEQNSQSQKQIADVAHPQDVAKLVYLPVMSRLRDKEQQGKKAKQAKLFVRDVVDAQLVIDARVCFFYRATLAAARAFVLEYHFRLMRQQC